jgi:hypothetical protein
MSGLGRFHFRSRGRNRETNERRLGLVRMVARSAIACRSDRTSSSRSGGPQVSRAVASLEPIFR